MVNPFMIFVMMVIPIAFFMIVWTIGVAYRLLAVEEPNPTPNDVAVLRKRMAEEGMGVPVGIREIREDQRCLDAFGDSSEEYVYEGLPRYSLPHCWIENLEQRRN